MLGGVLGQRDTAQAGAANPKLMLALGLLAMLAAHRQGGGAAPQESGGQAEGGGGLLGSLGGLGGLLGGLTGGTGGTGAGGLGELGSLLGGLLGGQAGAAQAGAAAGGIGVLQQVLAQAGLGQQVDSWIGTGANQPVSASDLNSALGHTGALASLAQASGMSQEDVASQLSEGLPELIDKLTPNGQVPPAA